MDSLDSLTSLLGWCSAINIGVLMFASLMVISMRDTIVSIHARMFGLSEGDLLRAYFQYLAQYKIAIFILNIVPYIALKITA